MEADQSTHAQWSQNRIKKLESDLVISRRQHSEALEELKLRKDGFASVCAQVQSLESQLKAKDKEIASVEQWNSILESEKRQAQKQLEESLMKNALLTSAIETLTAEKRNSDSKEALLICRAEELDRVRLTTLESKRETDLLKLEVQQQQQLYQQREIAYEALVAKEAATAAALAQQQQINAGFDELRLLHENTVHLLETVKSELIVCQSERDRYQQSMKTLEDTHRCCLQSLGAQIDATNERIVELEQALKLEAARAVDAVEDAKLIEKRALELRKESKRELRRAEELVEQTAKLNITASSSSSVTELELADLGNMGKLSRNASNGLAKPQVTALLSFTNPTERDFQQLDDDNKMLLQRLADTQKQCRQKDRRISVLTEQVDTLMADIKAKSKIIKSLAISKHDSSVLAIEADESSQVQSGYLASWFGGTGMKKDKDKDDSEVNLKLRNVLEETLIANISLKAQVETLGREVSKFQRSRSNAV